MVLSRIWSAFIIIAILVASLKFVFSDNYKSIYNDMVVGKGGDTVQIATKKWTEIPSDIQSNLNKNAKVEDQSIFYTSDSLKQNVQVFRVQETDGVIGTSKTAVEVCLVPLMRFRIRGYHPLWQKFPILSSISSVIQCCSPQPPVQALGLP